MSTCDEQCVSSPICTTWAPKNKYICWYLQRKFWHWQGLVAKTCQTIMHGVGPRLRYSSRGHSECSKTECRKVFARQREADIYIYKSKLKRIRCKDGTPYTRVHTLEYSQSKIPSQEMESCIKPFPDTIVSKFASGDHAAMHIARR